MNVTNIIYPFYQFYKDQICLPSSVYVLFILSLFCSMDMLIFVYHYYVLTYPLSSMTEDEPVSQI